MSIIRAQVRLHHSSALPEDDAINTFHFQSEVAGRSVSDDWTAIYNALTAFYGSIDTYLSRELSGQPTVTIYDLSDAEPRVPTLELNMTGVSFPASDNALPEEVALCLSFQGVAVSGEPQARRRGRVFLGPINGSANTVDGRPTTSFLNAVATAAGVLVDISGPSWVVYSRTDDPTPGVDSVAPLVNNGWIDNSFDTQRRRGQAPTARTTWS